MSHETIDGELTFNCDSKGCNHNYSAGHDKFKETWAEAKAHGWVNYQVTINSIDTWRTACPECAKKLGD